MIGLGSKYTVQQLLRRRDFGERMKQNKPLSVTELLYPLLVGYDSVHLHSDIEIGGTDQLFNFMASREIQKSIWPRSRGRHNSSIVRRNRWNKENEQKILKRNCR